jgi:hypothetical protein
LNHKVNIFFSDKTQGFDGEPRMGLIFITAGERSVACGSAKVRLFKPVFWQGQSPQATLSLACGYEDSAFQAILLITMLIFNSAVSSIKKNRIIAMQRHPDYLNNEIFF